MNPFSSNSVGPENVEIPSVSSVASIFRFQRWKPSKGETAPKLSENHPLSLYYYAEEHLSTAIKQLEKVRSVCSRRFHRHTERVHQAQKLLLDTIFLVYSNMDDSIKCPKPHRRLLPAEDQLELTQGFSENILFAAQAIVHGFHIRGIEHCSDELREPALQLCATLEALRHVFRTRCLDCPEPPYTGLFPVLMDFDRAWTEFEREICRSYFSAMQESEDRNRPPGFDLLTNHLQLTLEREINSGILDQDLVDELDPSIMFALPRLTLLDCMLNPEKPLLGANDTEMFLWFQPHVSCISHLVIQLSKLNSHHIQFLQQWLANSTPPLLSDTDADELKPLFTSICSIADALQGGPYSKPFLAALNLVFTGSEFESIAASI